MSFSQVFFSNIRLSSTISLLCRFQLLSMYLTAIVSRSFDFGNSHILVSFWRWSKQSRHELRDSSPDPLRSFVNCRGSEVGNSPVHVVDSQGLPRVSRLIVLQFSRALCSSATIQRKTSYTCVVERKIAGQYTNSLPSKVRKLLDGCSRCNFAFLSHPLKIDH